MNFQRGPKLSFSMPKQQQDVREEKSYSYFDQESTDCFRSEQKIKKSVNFAPTILIFLRYQDEEIIKFRDRLWKQVQQTSETHQLNPTLQNSKIQQQPKSCIRKQLDTDY